MVSLNCCHIWSWSTYTKNTSVDNFTDSTRIGAAHRCTMFLCHLDLEINTENSEYRNPNDNYNTKIIRQFTRIGGAFTSTVLGFKYMHSQFAAARVPSLEINLEWKHPCLSFSWRGLSPSSPPWSPSGKNLGADDQRYSKQNLKYPDLHAFLADPHQRKSINFGHGDPPCLAICRVTQQLIVLRFFI